MVRYHRTYIGAGAAVKFSLISATSVFALFSAATGPAYAAVLAVPPGQANIYDLVHDGVTSSDGGDTTVTRQDPSVLAVAALEAATVRWQQSSFTGPVDSSAMEGSAVPRIPLGAASGTRPDDDFATPLAGAWQWNTWQKSLAIGMARIAPLVGVIGNGPQTDEKSSETVYVSAGSSGAFNDGAVRSSSVAVAFAPSSTSTATITVAGAGNFRQRAGSGFSVAAANSLQTMPQADDQAPRATVLADTAQPTLGYNYAPAANTAGKAVAVEASFSDAVTASGVFARNNDPMPAKVRTSELQTGRGQPGEATNGMVQTSELQPGRGQPNRATNSNVQTSERQAGRGQPATANVQTSELQAARTQPGKAGNGNVQTSEAGYGQDRSGQFRTSDLAAGKLIDLTQPIDGSTSATQVDGTRTFISASVSANPSTTAALYMANVVNAAQTAPAGQTVEAFQIGPNPGPRAKGGSGTTVAEPLHGKILASAGPLNNSLALP